MKKYLLIPVLVLFMAGCSSSNEPKDVAKSFLEALAKGDIDGAKKNASASAVKVLDTIKAMGAMGADQMKNPEFKFTFVSEAIEGDEATIIYKDEKDQEKTISLVKEDGKWKVDFKK
jgi:hypothetical protein